MGIRDPGLVTHLNARQREYLVSQSLVFLFVTHILATIIANQKTRDGILRGVQTRVYREQPTTWLKRFMSQLQDANCHGVIQVMQQPQSQHHIKLGQHWKIVKLKLLAVETATLPKPYLGLLNISLADVIPPIVDIGKIAQDIRRTTADIEDLHSWKGLYAIRDKTLTKLMRPHERLKCGIDQRVGEDAPNTSCNLRHQ